MAEVRARGRFTVTRSSRFFATHKSAFLRCLGAVTGFTRSARAAIAAVAVARAAAIGFTVVACFALFAFRALSILRTRVRIARGHRIASIV